MLRPKGYSYAFHTLKARGQAEHGLSLIQKYEFRSMLIPLKVLNDVAVVRKNGTPKAKAHTAFILLENRPSASHKKAASRYSQ